MFHEFPHALARHVRTNEDLIFLRKISLDEMFIQEKLDQAGPTIWGVARYSDKPDVDFHNGFINTCSINHEPCDPLMKDFGNWLFGLCWDEFLKISPEATVVNLERGMISWSHNRGYMKAATPHRDSPILGEWSFLVHLKGNSGDTDFYSDTITEKLIKTVKFEVGNLMIFPSLYHHQGLLPDAEDNSDRYSANFIAKVATPLNEQILSKSPTSLQKIARS